MRHSSKGCLITHSHCAAVAKCPKMFCNNSDGFPDHLLRDPPQLCLESRVIVKLEKNFAHSVVTKSLNTKKGRKKTKTKQNNETN